MNFKDVYKSYNDEIKGNPEILSSILDGKAKAKPVFNYRPILAYAAMAVLVISVSVFGYNKFYGEPKPAKRYIASTKITDTNQTSQNAVLNETSPVPEESSPPQNSDEVGKYFEYAATAGTHNAVSDEERAAVSESAPLTDMQPDVSDAKQALPAETYAEAVRDAEAEVPEAASQYEEPDISSPMPASSGGSGVAVAAYGGRTADENQSSLMTADEYFEYLGTDIVSTAQLPADMVFDMPHGAKVEYEDGVIVSDMFTVTAYSEEDSQRSLSLSVSKKGPYAGRFTDDISYAYAEDGKKIVGAYTMAGDISVSLGVQNVTKEEINILMKSLKTEE